jgi:hypothetical protein
MSSRCSDAALMDARTPQMANLKSVDSTDLTDLFTNLLKGKNDENQNLPR